MSNNKNKEATKTKRAKSSLNSGKMESYGFLI